MPIYDFSQTPGSDATISGINIAEGCNPSTINNAIRQLMADTREVYASAIVASATTADIGAATGTHITISGTTTITGFGTVAAGTWRVCTFSGILTLTHNGTSLILPGSANIVTAVGDSLYAVSEGAGNWRVVAYQRASGAPVSLSTAQVATTYIADAAVTSVKIAAASVTLAKMGSGSSGTIISYATAGTATAVESGVTGTVLTSNGAGILPTYQATALQSSFTSTARDFSAAQLLTFAHALPSAPDIINLWLKCTVTDAGWAVNDEIMWAAGAEGGFQSYSPAVYRDTTNIYVKMPSVNPAGNAINKSTGAQVILDAAKWNVIVKARA